MFSFMKIRFYYYEHQKDLSKTQKAIHGMHYSHAQPILLICVSLFFLEMVMLSSVPKPVFKGLHIQAAKSDNKPAIV